MPNTPEGSSGGNEEREAPKLSDLANEGAWRSIVRYRLSEVARKGKATDPLEARLLQLFCSMYSIPEQTAPSSVLLNDFPQLKQVAARIAKHIVSARSPSDEATWFIKTDPSVFVSPATAPSDEDVAASPGADESVAPPPQLSDSAIRAAVNEEYQRSKTVAPPEGGEGRSWNMKGIMRRTCIRLRKLVRSRSDKA